MKSRGPSGENREYVYMLAEALEGLRREAGMRGEGGPVDEHVADLARRVREVEGKVHGGGIDGGAAKEDREEEMEEVEKN